MVPGVLKNEISGETESFQENLLEYPQYTRPEVWKGKPVPPVLLSGDHAKVDKWRLEQSIERTVKRRPDLYEKYNVEGRAAEWLKQDKLHHADMIEALNTGKASVEALMEKGILLKLRETDIYLASAQDLDAGERLLSVIEGNIDQICCHQVFLAESASRRFGLQIQRPCCQAAYTKKIPAQGTAQIAEKINEALQNGNIFIVQYDAEDIQREKQLKELGLKLSKKKIYWAIK